MQPNGLPNGHITVDEAIKMLNAETKEWKKDGNIDVNYMMSRSKWIEAGPDKNFRMPLIRPRKDINKLRMRYPHADPYENFKDVTIRVATQADEVMLKKAIADTYRRLAGKDYVEKRTRAFSTVASDGQVKMEERDPVYAKEGEAVGSGGEVSMTTQQGA